MSHSSTGYSFTLKDAIYHRFIQYQPNLNLIHVDYPNQVGKFSSTNEGQGTDVKVPVNYLNSLDHINSPVFIPDFNHDPTINRLLHTLHGKECIFEYYRCSVWKQEGWRINNTRTNTIISDIHDTKETALIWSTCVIPPPF